MKKLWIHSLAAIVALAVAAPSFAQELTTYKAQPGSKVKIDGTSTVHAWTVEGLIISGTLELDSKFAADPTKAQPGKLPAKVDAMIPVRSIKSGKKSMDDIMHAAMKQPEHPQIKYRLTELSLKETPKSAEGPFNFDSQGELTVAGVTNKVTFPVTMTRTGKTIKTTGATSVKMTSFGIQPPAPKMALGLITTGDEVKLNFEWVTGVPEAK
jgi:polyisoprenoid-binding protein YceI